MIGFERKEDPADPPPPSSQEPPQKPSRMPLDLWRLLGKDRRVKSLPWDRKDDWRDPDPGPDRQH